MAKAKPAPPDDDAEVTAKPKKGGKLKLIIIIVVLVVVLAGAGVVGLLLFKKGKKDDAGLEETAAAPTMVDLSKPPTFVPLDPFVVNLALGEGDRFLQVVMSLRVADTKLGDSLKGFMPQIRHRINLLLSSKLPSELATTEGREALAEEITNGVNEVLGAPGGAESRATAPVQAVLFSSFIIQ
jgi:flagellar FliL protein